MYLWEEFKVRSRLFICLFVFSRWDDRNTSMCPWAIYIKRRKERFEWWKIYVAIVFRLSCNTGEKKLYLIHFISCIHIIFNINPVCVLCCFFHFIFFLFGVVCLWELHDWFVDVNTHISMLKKEKPLLVYCIYMTYFIIILFFSSNNQGVFETACFCVLFLSRILHDLSVCGVEECMWISSGFVLDKKCYVMYVFAISN